MTDTDTTNLKPYLVTTEYRGIFFGYADDTSGDTITLKNARLALYWSQGGFMSLASKGPVDADRVGERADITLRKVTAVLPVTDEAARAWESANVYRR